MRAGRCLWLLAVLSLQGCGANVEPPPRQVNNACAILDEKDHWEDPLFKTSREWDVTPGTILSFIKHESSFRGDAQPVDKDGNLRSSAKGYSQALKGTWAEYEEQRRSGDRENFSHSIDFMGWYLDRISRITLIPKNDPENLYMAYHEGPTGYKRGSHLKKAWLQKVAFRVAQGAMTYDTQLFRCREGEMEGFVPVLIPVSP